MLFWGLPKVLNLHLCYASLLPLSEVLRASSFPTRNKGHKLGRGSKVMTGGTHWVLVWIQVSSDTLGMLHSIHQVMDQVQAQPWTWPTLKACRFPLKRCFSSFGQEHHWKEWWHCTCVYVSACAYSYTHTYTHIYTHTYTNVCISKPSDIHA